MDARNPRPRIERLPSGEFQFVRPLSAHRPSHENTRPKAPEKISRKREGPDRARRTPLSIAEIENLITIYAATGEGRGAYLAAVASEERQYGPGGRDFYRSQRRYNLSRRDHRGFRLSDDDDDDDDDDYRRGGRGPTKGPPSGPAPTRMSRTWDRPYGRYHDGTYDAHPMPKRDVYRQGANVRYETVARPVPVVVSGGLQSGHDSVFTEEGSGHHSATAKKSSHVEEKLERSRERGRSPVIESYNQPQYAARRMSRSQRMEERIHSVDRVMGRARSSRRQQPTRFQSSNEWPERRDIETTSGLYMQRPQYTVNIPGQGSIDNSVGQRSGGGYDYESEMEESQYSVHLRGGADPLTLRRPPTRTSATGAGLSVEDTPREIELYFYYSRRGKIICSGKHEHYNTFQELLPVPVGRRNRAQCADDWLVNKLHEHYRLLRQSEQNYPWNLMSMKTIGFASFIRFQHPNSNTVITTRDRTDYIVTAKDNAIHADPLESALQQFKYLMEYPPRSKIMLCHLDEITRESQSQDPRNIDDFYAVEIKETLDTRKIWILLILLIVVSTGGGTAYAVVKSDTSTGLALATYILTVLGIVIAFVGAGEYFGMQKPDPFSFVYSLEENQVLRANHVHHLFGR